MQSNNSSRAYIIDLNSRRSKRALLAALAVSVCTFIAVTSIVMRGYLGNTTFRYFTILSNLLSAAGAMFMIPYAVEGIRKKRFTLPGWVSRFQYAGAVSVFITMFCACTIITITFGVRYAFEGPHLWLHLIIPILAIVLFLTTETGHYISKKETVLAQIPYWTYVIIYAVMVVGIGEERGGWADMYEATSRLPIWLVLLLLAAIGYAVAVFLRFIHNRSVTRGLNQLTARWGPDITDVELKIEAYGLGRYMAQHLDESEIVIPMDIFRLMTQRCEVSLDDLTRAYSRGVVHGLKEK